MITNPHPGEKQPRIVNTALYDELEAAQNSGAPPVTPQPTPGDNTGTLTEQQIKNIINTKITEALATVAGASSFGLLPGLHYYSPISYWWVDYYNRGTEAGSKWDRVNAFGDTLGIVILNKSSGAWGEAVDNDFLTQGKMAEAAGAKLISFYVKTRFGANSRYATPAYKQRIQKSLGVPMDQISSFTEEYIVKTAKNIVAWYRGQDKIQKIAIFLDEVVNGWDDEQKVIMPYYIELYKRLKKELGEDVPIIINPGSNTRLEMMDACDIAVTYESDAAKYIAAKDTDIHPAHYSSLPSWRFWHIVHGITESNADAVFDKADRLGIGHLYATNRTFKIGGGNEDEPEENPYADPPSDWMVPRVRAWIKGVLPFEKRVTALEAELAALKKAK